MKLESSDHACGEGSPQRPQDGPRAILAAGDLSPLEDWQRAHALLLAQERTFSELVDRHARGRASRQELEAGRREVQAFRDLADAVLEKGFGVHAASASPAKAPHGR